MVSIDRDHNMDVTVKDYSSDAEELSMLQQLRLSLCNENKDFENRVNRLLDLIDNFSGTGRAESAGEEMSRKHGLESALILEVEKFQSSNLKLEALEDDLRRIFG